MVTRRRFLGDGIMAAAAVAVPRPLFALLGHTPEPVPPIDDPRLAALAARALESAHSAGASYADIRLTHTRTRRFELIAQDEESVEVGVRALVDGYWGFASGPIWSPDEMARLGREAAHEAQVNTTGRPRTTTLAPAPVVPKEHWVMPIDIDPFERSPLEILDHVASLTIFAHDDLGLDVLANRAIAIVQDEAFASTTGSYCTQRRYSTGGLIALAVTVRGQAETCIPHCLSRAGMGWELYAADRIPRVREHSVQDEIRRCVEESKEFLRLPMQPIDVGRYDTALDATSMGMLLETTLGRATELDRAFGYEANAGGTSFLNDPRGMMGSYQAGASLLTVTANRSERGGAATVKWDAEGVAPDDFTLVNNGVLADFQTTRESASWLADRYAALGASVHSHGCANAPSAVYPALTHTPNLVMAPGAGGDFESMVSGMSDGIAVTRAEVEADFQYGAGMILGRTVVVKRGKRVARLPGAGLLFRTPELWRSLAAVGGDASLRRVGFGVAKGEPPQTCHHSATTPPALCKGLTLIDSLRKA